MIKPFQKYFITIILFILSFDSFSQNFRLIGANSVKSGRSGKQDLIGNVAIQQDDMIIYCDKAELDKKNNSFDGMGNLHVIKGNSMHIYSDFLFYDGNKKSGKFRKNIKLKEEGQTLYTEFFDFNGYDNSGYFYKGGKIIDSTQTLESKTGYYYPKTKSYIFKDDVVIKNKDYTVYSDTLKYLLDKKIVFVYGPTRIISDSNFIYCENGWYDTKQDKAQFNKNAYFKNKNQQLNGDSLYYDRKLGLGKGLGNVALWDSIENIVVKGEYIEYHEKPERALVTKKAQFIQIDQNNDSLFLHADTLRSLFDTAGNYRILKAYRKAQIYKSDFQARSDSIVYTLKDSTIRMFYEPVLWMEQNQITAHKIDVHLKKNKLDFAKIEKNSFLISMKDTARFDQIKGENMMAYFKKNQLYLIDINEKALSVYYAKDGKEFIGVNKAESSKMKIYIDKKEVEKVVFLNKPSATLYPLEKMPKDLEKLEGFKWLEEYRPKDKLGIFSWKEMLTPEKTKNTKNKK